MSKIRKMFVRVYCVGDEDPGDVTVLADVELRTYPTGFNVEMLDLQYQFVNKDVNELIAGNFSILVVEGIDMHKEEIRQRVRDTVLKMAEENERKEG